MLIGATLGRYFAMRFVRTILGVFLTVFTLIYTLDFVELLRRAGDAEGASTGLMAQLSLYRTPAVAEGVLPFAILFGSMAALLQLSRKLELVVARAAGISAWQFLQPGVFVALAIGAFTVGVYNPISALMKQRSTEIEAKIFARSTKANSGKDLWIRQRSLDGQAILRAETAIEGTTTLAGVSVFTFDEEGRFVSQIEAARAMGFPPGAIMRRVMIPVMLVSALPALVNFSIILTKETVILSMITVPEIMFETQTMMAETFAFAEATLVAPGEWDIRGRLRGQAGTDAMMPAVWPAGSVVVLIDGRDVREVTQGSLRSAVALVPQDVALFNDSIGNNIAYARPGADPAAVEAAAREVGFLGFGFYPRSGFIHVDLGPARQWGERFPVRATAFAAETPPAREVLADSRTMKGGGAAGVATLGAAGVEVARDVLAETQTAILPLVSYLETLRWVFIAVALVGIVVTIYARLDDWKRGRR